LEAIIESVFNNVQKTWFFNKFGFLFGQNSFAIITSVSLLK
jgi:high-affinity nickel permease